MFYDIDILNRRGGKFGVIWLAANGKLRLKGKGSRNDLRLVEGVKSRPDLVNRFFLIFSCSKNFILFDQ